MTSETVSTMESFDNNDEEKEAMGKPPAVPTVAASSTTVASDDYLYQDDEDFGSERDDNPMPLINYTRLTGSIPRVLPRAVPGEGVTAAADSGGSGSMAGTLSDKCTCSALGKVTLDPSTTSASDVVNSGGISSMAAGLDLSIQRNPSGGSGGGSMSNSGSGLDPQRPELFLTSDLWRQPHYVLALGFATGEISLVNVRTGITVIEQQLKVREGWMNSNKGPPIVDLSFDSSGSHLCAIDAGGTCAVWELKFVPSLTSPQVPDSSQSMTVTTTQPSSSSATQPTADSGMFSSFMSKLTGVPPTSSAAPTSTTTTTTNSGSAAETPSSSTPATAKTSSSKFSPSLTATVVQVTHIAYPQSFGVPTCMALDPAHKRRREKSLVTGFADGRLVLTRRGFFQRRNDSILYQGAAKSTEEKSYRGIEAIAWRGSLVAWADASGIKLLDADTLTRIAHIDRPTGARPTLYPTISSLRPSLQFETSTTLLIAWGDCLMNMAVREVHATPVGSAMTGLDGGGGQQGVVVKRRAVECTMAWELDCIACGVVPLDEEYCVVLGLVPPLDGEDDDTTDLEGEIADNTQDSNQGSNDLEVQIVSRKDGTIVYSDSLPMLKKFPSRLEQIQPQSMAESALGYTLLSSFAVTRMDDVAEAEEARIGAEMDQEFDLNVPLFSPAGEMGGKRTFRDAHRDWDLNLIRFDDEEKLLNQKTGVYKLPDENTDETLSVDSDDYAFVIEPIPEESLERTTSTAPVMVVTSNSDVVLSLMADLDDAIDHALSRNKHGLALRRALRHKRQLRRYELSDLVSNYLQAVLRIPQQGAEDDGGELATHKSSLSLRRMKLAVQSMPALFGGHVALWERWAFELEHIPGAVFLLREHLPVRDPILPPNLYERMLKTMLKEAEQLSFTPEGDANNREVALNVAQEAQEHFLSTLIAWGPTKVLKEYIKLFKHIRESRGEDSNEDNLRGTEILLQRRYLQTAAGYLSFPVHPTSIGDENRRSLLPYQAHNDDSRDSLFDPSNVLKVVISRDASGSDGTLDDVEARLDLSSPPTNSRMRLDAFARLRMMEDRYDLALQGFLAIGSLHSPVSLAELESAAIEEVNKTPSSRKGRSPILIESSSYEFIMGIIEFHHLHQFLLNKDFLSSMDSSLSTPLFSLLRLVGLDVMGEFLINHCVSPDFESSRQPEKKSSRNSANSEFDDRVRRETLPIDQVAEQLGERPRILHWYLHKVFTQVPEIYVKFPNTANPPKAVTDLHREHFELYVEFAGGQRDSVKALSGTETYKVESVTTPLLSFLKAALPLGGIRPVDARRLLENNRNKRDDDDEESSFVDRSHNFALELAYIIEHYSEETEAEAKGVLDLFLQGCDSVVLAVSYAQRQRQHSSVLWEKLISYCLSTDVEKGRGLLFGALLEAAALSGADLARLVAKIPPGMAVEGLRPRLVAAVADYRFKLDIHEAAATAATVDRNALLREVTHRSRRGVRFQRSDLRERKLAALMEKSKYRKNPDKSEDGTILPKTLRTVERRDHYRIASSLPMR